MKTFLARRVVGVVVLAATATSLSRGAESSRATPDRTSGTGTSQRATAGRAGTVKGPLPDPLLLDGSTQTAEKKSEYGMIGDFELPGDENVRNGKVGGPQDPSPSGNQGSKTQGAPAQTGDAGGQSGSPNNAATQAQGGGSAGGEAGQQGGAQPPNGAQAGGGPGGGPENPNAAGKPIGGAGEAGGQPQGVQVAELGGGAAGQPGAPGDGGPNGKPTAVAIGDKAMRIEPSTTASGVVGSQQQIAGGHVQQHDKGTGTGGKGPSSPQGPGRVEKGRVIPAGL